MRAGAVGRGVAAAVARGHRHVQPGSGLQPVLGLDLHAERVPLLAVRGAAEQYRAGVLPDGRPRHPAGEAVDGVHPGGLGEAQLVFGAAEDVAPAVDPVRPGGQQLARGSSSAWWPANTGWPWKASSRSPEPSSVTVAR